MKGQLAALPLIAMALLATALLAPACSPAATSGPATAAPSPAAPSSAAPSSGGSSAAAALAAIQPCDLLGKSFLARNDLTSSGPTTGSGARSCRFQRKTGLNTAGFVIGVDIRDGQGIKDMNRAGLAVSNDPVGRHQAVQAMETDGDLCDVTIGITPGSRVDISANLSNPDIVQACKLADQYAKLIEPRLP